MVASIRGPDPRGHGIGPINPTSLRDLRDCCLLAKIEYSISDAAEELWQRLQQAAAPEEVRQAVTAARIEQLEAQNRELQSEVQALRAQHRCEKECLADQKRAQMAQLATCEEAAISPEQPEACRKQQRRTRRNRTAHRRRKTRQSECATRKPGVPPDNPHERQPPERASPSHIPQNAGSQPMRGGSESTNLIPAAHVSSQTSLQTSLFPPSGQQQPQSQDAKRIFNIPDHVLYLDAPSSEASRGMDALVQGACDLQARIQQLSQKQEPLSSGAQTSAIPPDNEAANQPAQRRPSKSPSPGEPAASAPATRPHAALTRLLACGMHKGRTEPVDLP